MKAEIYEIPVDEIRDWESFHDVFARELHFADYYGRNMDAWNDCVSDLVVAGSIVVISLGDCREFAKRCPEQYQAVLECAAFVNYREMVAGGTPWLVLSLAN